jgi:hypothetical protein
MRRSPVYAIFYCIVIVIGACNQTINSTEPALSKTQPPLDNTVIPSDLISKIPATPSRALSTILSPENTPLADDPGCFDDMKILATYGSVPVDGFVLLNIWPGQEVDLGWRIQNTGTCVWDSAYGLEQVNKDQNEIISASTPEKLNERITPGNSVTVQFKIAAPLSPGDYVNSWKLLNGYRNTVGPLLSVIIHVPGDSSNRPLPTKTIKPNVQFEASSTQVVPYSRVVLSWEVIQAKKVYFFTTGQSWVPNQVALRGNRIYYPSKDMAYNLRVVNLNNTVESFKIEVEVEPPSGLPDIVLLDLTPKGKLVFGGCVDIIWKVRGGTATGVSLFANDTLLLADGGRVGEYTDCPTQVGSMVYTLVASGPAGTVIKSKTIDVQP